MKYLLSYMTMFIAMIITLLLGGGFTTVLGIAILTLIFSTFFWEKWLEITKRLKLAPTSNSRNRKNYKHYMLIIAQEERNGRGNHSQVD